MKYKKIKSSLIGFLTLGYALPALASVTAGVPWETPLASLTSSVSTSVVRAVCIIAIVICGATLAFGEAGGALKQGIRIVFGISMAIGSITIFTTFFGGAAAVAF